MTTKNILLILASPINKLSEEAVLAVFALASFEHHIQIALTGEALQLLENPTHKLCHMLASIELYDIPPVWLIGDNIKNSANSTELAFATLPMAEKAPDFLNATHDVAMVWQV